MRISDWSSDVCSSDLLAVNKQRHPLGLQGFQHGGTPPQKIGDARIGIRCRAGRIQLDSVDQPRLARADDFIGARVVGQVERHQRRENRLRSEEHTSELQSLMRNSYAVFCLKKKTKKKYNLNKK